MENEKESIKVLRECINLQLKKGNDYQNKASVIRQADYYPRGVSTLLDIIHAKMLRLRSVISAMESDANYIQNFESIEDSAKDMANYASFMVAYCRGKMDGQIEGRDFLNRPLPAIDADEFLSAIRWTGSDAPSTLGSIEGGQTVSYIPNKGY